MASLPIQTELLRDGKGVAEHGPDTWLKEPCVEYTLVSAQYDFALSLLHLVDTPVPYEESEEPEEDISDRMTNRTPGMSWLD